MSEEVEINGQNVRVELQGGGYYTYSEEKVKLPEMTIGCPACNDVEHRMTIFVHAPETDNCHIQCEKCGAIFRLVRTKIKVSNRTYTVSEKFKGLV